MSELVRAAIVGTGQLPPSDNEHSGTAVDGLVAQLHDVDRERALLLRAGGLALLRRSARRPTVMQPSLDAAGEESLRLPSERLHQLLTNLISESDDELLAEAYERMARAKLRLPEQLLPAALSKSGTRQRGQLPRVLGARGRWLAQLRPEWTWALAPSDAEYVSAQDVVECWEDAAPAERRTLLVSLRRLDPGLARKLVAASWKNEKAEQRLAWVELFSTNLSAADEPLLAGMLSDRSTSVRHAAATLLWCLPEGELALRLRTRLDALVSFKAPAGGILGALKSLVSEDPGTLRVELPPEDFDGTWEKDGIVEAPPQGVGRRQWWLQQLFAAVPPDHWVTRFGVSAEQLVRAALAGEHGHLVVDGLTSAALRHRAADWYAPLWDARVLAETRGAHNEHELWTLSERLTPELAEPRMLALFERDRTDLLASFRRPWPHSVATRFLSGMTTHQPEWVALLPVAAMAIPYDVLPTTLVAPAVPEGDFRAQEYLRAFDRFQSTASARRTIAEEMAP